MTTKHSDIFYSKIYPKYKKLLKFDVAKTTWVKQSIDRLYGCRTDFQKVGWLFESLENLETDFEIFKYYVYQKNELIFNDHTPALRLYRQTKTTPRGLLLLFKKSPCSFIKELINLHIDTISSSGFFLCTNELSNHCCDQLLALLNYNSIFKNVKNIERYQKLFDSYLEKTYTVNGIHVENSPHYHYYSIRQLYQSLSVEQRERVKNYLSLCIAPNNNIVNIGDGNFQEIFEIDKISIFDNINFDYTIDFSTYYETGAGFNYFDCGHLIIKYDNIYFFIKSSLKHSWHHHYDNNSFVLFYKGYNFFIDAGMHSYEYKSFGRKFVTSPQAHNLFVLNDDKILQRPHGLYHCESVRVNYNTYKFISEYYKNIRYERTVEYDNTKKIFYFTDHVGNIPSEYKNYYILFHLNKNTQASINGTTVDIKVGNACIVLKLTEEANLKSVHNVLDGDFDDMHIGYNSPERNKIVKIPTIVFKFENNGLVNKHSFEIVLK